MDLGGLGEGSGWGGSLGSDKEDRDELVIGGVCCCLSPSRMESKVETEDSEGFPRRCIGLVVESEGQWRNCCRGIRGCGNGSSMLCVVSTLRK